MGIMGSIFCDIKNLKGLDVSTEHIDASREQIATPFCIHCGFKYDPKGEVKKILHCEDCQKKMNTDF